MYYKNVLDKNPEDAYKDLSGLAVELLPIKEHLERIEKNFKTLDQRMHKRSYF